ncbi:MAG: tetratricopeptide repeat protein [Spirochaetaceae bacterium]|nr:tetratricopeptide repeat protein [Spirochaetaceae bacterium]
MQQNELTARQKFLKSFSSFLSSRGKLLLLLLIVLILAIIGIAINSEIKSSIIEKSTVLIEELEDKYNSEFSNFEENSDDPKKAELMETILSSLDDIIAKYSSYYAGQRALYMKGEIYFTEKQYDKALESYTALANKYKKSYLAPISLNNVAVCYEELGDNDSAINYYKKIIDNYSTNYPNIPHALFSLGRLYETKEEFNTAIEYYNMVADKYADSDWTIFSKNRIIFLKGAGKV